MNFRLFLIRDIFKVLQPCSGSHPPCPCTKPNLARRLTTKYWVSYKSIIIPTTRLLRLNSMIWNEFREIVLTNCKYILPPKSVSVFSILQKKTATQSWRFFTNVWKVPQLASADISLWKIDKDVFSPPSGTTDTSKIRKQFLESVYRRQQLFSTYLGQIFYPNGFTRSYQYYI